MSVALAVGILLAWIPSGTADLPPTAAPDPLVPENTGMDVRLHFASDSITPVPATTNNTVQSTPTRGLAVGGHFLGTKIGEWSRPLAADLSIGGDMKAELWVRSEEGAKNARVQVQVMKNGADAVTVTTDGMDLGSSPSLLTVTGSYEMQFAAGDTLGVILYWFSDPTRVVGPSAGGEFLYGSREVDSRLTLHLAQNGLAIVNISVPPDQVSRDSLVVKADFTDALGVDPASLTYQVSIAGPTVASPDTVKGPDVGAAGNVTSVTWRWIHSLDHAKNGLYTVTVAVSYDGNNTAMNATIVPLVLITEPPPDPCSGPTAAFCPPSVLPWVAAFSGGSIAAVGGFLLRRRHLQRRTRRQETAPEPALNWPWGRRRTSAP